MINDLPRPLFARSAVKHSGKMPKSLKKGMFPDPAAFAPGFRIVADLIFRWVNDSLSSPVTKPISDEYCPHCDNHFVIDAVTPKPAIKVEGEDARIDSRYVPLQSLCPQSSYLLSTGC